MVVLSCWGVFPVLFCLLFCCFLVACFPWLFFCFFLPRLVLCYCHFCATTADLIRCPTFILVPGRPWFIPGLDYDSLLNKSCFFSSRIERESISLLDRLFIVFVFFVSSFFGDSSKWKFVFSLLFFLFVALGSTCTLAADLKKG